ncbi:hypothetical protein [Sodalis glossinidius]|uniref:hypothetical protein n=1 Tax=Sodalis glossinidius TaxID=63612 RepID=UPI0002FB7347|nr:hypothetical protein [Sodalis glossinidius]
MSIIAGTLFDDLVSEENFPLMVDLTHKICRNLSALSRMDEPVSQDKPAAYLVIIDFGDPERAATAGRSEKATRLKDSDWQTMMRHITVLSEIAWKEFGYPEKMKYQAVETRERIERELLIPHS